MICLLFVHQLFQYWYLTFGEFCGCYIFVELCYFQFGLKCIYFFWSVNNLFLDGYYIFINYVILNMSWRLEVYVLLSRCKELIFIWILYLILSGLKWIMSYSCQFNMTCFLSVSSESGHVNCFINRLGYGWRVMTWLLNGLGSSWGI